MTTTAQLFLSTTTDEVGASLMEEVGTLVFQSALMYYLAAHSEEEASLFETYVAAHVTTDSFIDDLCVEFPEFEQVLLAEIHAFRVEVYA